MNIENLYDLSCDNCGCFIGFGGGDLNCCQFFCSEECAKEFNK